MKTLLFCTSYAESEATWNERWGRWLKAIVHSELQTDKILIVDDGSPVLPRWNGIPVVPAEIAGTSDSKVEIRHFQDRRGRNVNKQPFPGWYRSFSHAVLHAIKGGFDKVIHIEADAYLISNRAVTFFNSFNRGWAGLWCGRHKWPESTLQIICRDQFTSCEVFFSQPYSAHLRSPYKAIEQLIPFTFINRMLIGDRYGEIADAIPFGADYVSQVRWNQRSDYYWWMAEDGTRTPIDKTEHGVEDIVSNFCRDTSVMRHEGLDYREFMRFLDHQMIPRSYLEIGTYQGDSLGVVTCDTICVDPNFQIQRNVIKRRRRSFFFQMTSDEFFDENDPRTIIGDVDLGFLDGLHHFEALLRDFINFERCSHAGSLVLLHDCLPLNTRMASRDHQPGPETESTETRYFWTGDVWRVLPILREFRQDLEIVLLDCPPTGLVLISKLDNRSTKLMYNFESIVKRYASLELSQYQLADLWGSLPFLSSRKIVADPRLFCSHFRFRL